MNKSARIFSFLLLSFSIAFSGNSLAFCWGGRHPTVQEEFKSSDYIVIGHIERSKNFSSPDDPDGVDRIEYYVRVDRLFKGRPAKFIKVVSENSSSRFDMNSKDSYLLFVVGSSENGMVDSCGNSGESNLRSSEIFILKSLSSE